MKHRPIFLTLFVLLFLCLVGVLVGAAPARASTTITVSTTSDELNDDGQCSLREAIRAANLDTASGATPGECPAGSGADTITLPSGIYTLTILGASEDADLTGDLDITSALTINGASAASTIVNGGGLDRVFQITGTVNVTIAGVTISGGVGSLPNTIGGGIKNAGMLTVTNSIIRDNTLNGINNSGTLTLSNTNVISNINSGIVSGGVLNLVNSNVISNTLGGIYSLQATIANSLISSNTGSGIDNVGVLTLTNSSVISNTSRGIYNHVASVVVPKVTLINSSVISNTANGLPNNDGNGGGIYNSGELVAFNSIVQGNTSANDGGGIYVAAFSRTSLTSVTITGNKAGANGGGLSYYASYVPPTLNNVTVVSNTADSNSDGSGDGGGLYNADSRPMTLTNTLLAQNVDMGAQAQDCSGTLASLGYNLIQSTTGCTITPTIGDITNTAPLLGPLQDNGGPTWTHALLPGSPAIDAGDNATCTATDQRGAVRPFDGDGNGNAVCDIGAYEFGALIPSAWLHLPLVMRGP